MANKLGAIAGIILLISSYNLYRRRRSIQSIPGPTSPSWTFGHMLQLFLPIEYGDNEFAWLKSFGAVYRIKGCFGQDRLLVSDPAALQYILNNPRIFPHGPGQKIGIDLVFPEKCVMREHGDVHKRLRAALNPSFTGAAVRNYQPIFERVAQNIIEKLEESSASPINVCPILSEATLSTVCEAALGYTFHDLDKDFVVYNERLLALSANQSQSQIIADAIMTRLPTWLLDSAMKLPSAAFEVIQTSKRLAIELGMKIIDEKVELAQQGSVVETDVFDALLDVTDSHSGKRKHALTREEIAAQTGMSLDRQFENNHVDLSIGILLVGGEDTTSNTLAFGLLELAKDPILQEALRAEIQSVGGSSSGFDNMPLLNAFVKETLRVYPVGPIQERISMQDTVIPLSEPLKTTTGRLINEIPIPKGQIMNVAIASYQRLPSRWGGDSHTFRPSRWLDGGVTQGQAVGPYANLLSFLGGPRVCLGWRFAILEMQVFFSELISKCSFALPEGSERITMRLAGSLTPVLPNGEKGVPLCVTRI
ncbi:cytochrome P450 [Favolaschia claudopus]|uniref:Cytochrome P450 n=1 Tax=Favolaschia claudopus TaxID=2862362 RepID=A0AAW0CSH1_9AGAR